MDKTDVATGKLYLYKCGACKKVIIEDDDQYDECPACGASSPGTPAAGYVFEKTVTKAEVPEGAVYADDLFAESEGDEPTLDDEDLEDEDEVKV